MKIGRSLFHTELVTVSCEAGDIYITDFLIKKYITDTNLPATVKELLHYDLDLLKEDWVKCGRHFVADQFLDVFLNLRAKFFVRANKEAQQLTEELSDGAILDVLAGTVRKNTGIESETRQNLCLLTSSILWPSRGWRKR